MSEAFLRSVLGLFGQLVGVGPRGLGGAKTRKLNGDLETSLPA